MKYRVTLIPEFFTGSEGEKPEAVEESVDCDEVAGTPTDYMFVNRRGIATVDGKGAKQGVTVVALYPRNRVLKIEIEGRAKT